MVVSSGPAGQQAADVERVAEAVNTSRAPTVGPLLPAVDTAQMLHRESVPLVLDMAPTSRMLPYPGAWSRRSAGRSPRFPLSGQGAGTRWWSCGGLRYHGGGLPHPKRYFNPMLIPSCPLCDVDHSSIRGYAHGAFHGYCPCLARGVF